MSETGSTPTKNIDSLRRKFYNAQLTHARLVHDELKVLRIRPDSGRPEFEPGQYTLLGLVYLEPRVDGVVAEKRSEQTLRHPLIRRAYSISCSMLDDGGTLVTTSDVEYVEIYIALVHKPLDEPPTLTPRLFALEAGDRLYLGTRAHGHYTLSHVGPDDDVVLLATGTGEAPHNAMLAELLARGHRGRIFNCTCVRYRADLAYLDVHRELEQRYANYRYFALTTREPENLDRSHPQYVGKQYLQDFFSAGRFEEQAGIRLDPQRTHVYLCGNPMMIGLPERGQGNTLVYPEPPGMVEVLVRRGFQLDEPHAPGNLHFEKYW